MRTCFLCKRPDNLLAHTKITTYGLGKEFLGKDYCGMCWMKESGKIPNPLSGDPEELKRYYEYERRKR